MAKAKKSVEEELELATVVKGSSSKGFRIPSNPSNKVKTNNFFKMMNNKTNVLTYPRQNGSSRTSPAQSVLTLPEPSSMSEVLPGLGVSEVASIQNGPLSNGTERNAQDTENQPSSNDFKPALKAAKECCTKSFKKSCAGVVISVLVASTLVSATQFLKALYMGGMSLDSHGLRPVSSSAFNNQETSRNLSSTKYYHHRATINQTSTELSSSATTSTSSVVSEDFYAPFFTTWFCSMGTILFLPIYLIGLLLSGAKSSKIRANLKESIQSFRSKGFTLGKFCNRSSGFCALWVLTNFLFIRALAALGSTEVIALFATNVSFVYLLSWVVLHEQFVGIRIVAVIL